MSEAFRSSFCDDHCNYWLLEKLDQRSPWGFHRLAKNQPRKRNLLFARKGQKETEMSVLKDGKFSKIWNWLRWVLLVALVVAILIWGLPWIVNQFQKPAQAETSAESAQVLSVLATIHANQEAISERLDDLEATPVVLTEVEEEEAVEALPSETPPAPEITEEVVEALELKTAADMRDLGRVIGWVTGGNEGQYVAGAQLEMKNDVPLLDILQDGVVYEFQCVHYLQINGEVHSKPVCEGGLVRFGTESVLFKGTIGTIWLPMAVQSDATEEWLEGFLNEPCECADGDCRD